MSQRSRLRGQDGFIREVVWVVVVLAVIAVVVLDAMAIFSAHQSAADEATRAANAAKTDYAQSLDVGAAKLAAAEYLARASVEMTGFKATQAQDGTVQFTIKTRATANTYAFRYLAKIPQLKAWVERTTNPTGSGSAE